VFQFKTILLISLCAAVTILGLVNLDQFGEDVAAPVTLQADEDGHFFGELTINGVPLTYIVDSGASNVTMNSLDARKAQINYIESDVIELLTPNGEVPAFSLKVSGLVIGHAILNGVDVTVIEGDSPPYVLLGLSAQRMLDVKRDNEVMTLGLKP